MKLIAHCLVKNEENFIWYAINSVIDYVDEIMVWDTGSTDKTVEIIKSIKSNKIKFREIGGESTVSEVRQKMLSETQADWIFVLDGDEIWGCDGIEELKDAINKNVDVIASPNYMLIGDMYHYQEEKAGKYNIAGRTGHYNLRAFRNISGLKVEGVYPDEAYTVDGIKLQNFAKEKIYFLRKPYLHASHLRRSSKDTKKLKHEIGEEFPLDFYYPEVFFRPRPENTPFIWGTMDGGYKNRARLETPLKKIKRRI